MLFTCVLTCVLTCLVELTSAVQFHMKQKVGELCGMDEVERKVYVCDHGLNCNFQTMSCQRWYIEVEKGQNCGMTDIANINCEYPATCLEGVCVELNKMAGETCGKHDVCHSDYKCVNCKCETHSILKDWFHKLFF